MEDRKLKMEKEVKKSNPIRLYRDSSLLLTFLSFILHFLSSKARRCAVFAILICFFAQSIAPQEALAQTFAPAINTLIPLSPAFTPTLVRGIRVYPDNPLKFDFIVDSGDSGLQGDELKSESEKLIRYFLASLTLPENDLWVNLSPYEKDRIVPTELGTTEMGIDMLAQDYLLKQITASLTNPDSDLGKEFWQKIYKQSYEKFGTTNVPVDTFNKVWIMPDKAEVYVQEDKAFVVESRLKVMLESDYLAAQVNSEKHLVSSQKSNEESLENGEEKHRIPDTRYPSQAQNNSSLDTIHSSLDTVSSQIAREVFIPVLEKEVNEGKNFAQLRQIYNSIILSYWYKTNLKESILNKVYADKRKVKGLEVVNSEKYLVSSQKSNEESLENGEEKHQIPDTRYPSQVQSNSLPDTIHSSPDTVQIIYQQYLQTFKKGVCNMMKVEYDPYAKKNIPRKYFAGGATFNFGEKAGAIISTTGNIDAIYAFVQKKGVPEETFIMEVALNDPSVTVAGDLAPNWVSDNTSVASSGMKGKDFITPEQLKTILSLWAKGRGSFDSWINDPVLKDFIVYYQKDGKGEFLGQNFWQPTLESYLVTMGMGENMVEHASGQGIILGKQTPLGIEILAFDYGPGVFDQDGKVVEDLSGILKPVSLRKGASNQDPRWNTADYLGGKGLGTAKLGDYAFPVRFISINEGMVRVASRKSPTSREVQQKNFSVAEVGLPSDASGVLIHCFVPAKLTENTQLSMSEATAGDLLGQIQYLSVDDGKKTSSIIDIVNPKNQKRFYGKKFKGKPFYQKGNEFVYISMTALDEGLKREVAQRVIRELKGLNLKNPLILSIGAGQGHEEIELAKQGLTNIEAIDITPENIKAAQDQMKAAKVHGINFKVGDAEHLDYPGRKFDVVLFNESIGGLNPALALAEAKRVLKQGGCIILTTYNAEKETVEQDPSFTHYIGYSVGEIREMFKDFDFVEYEEIESKKGLGILNFFVATKKESLASVDQDSIVVRPKVLNASPLIKVKEVVDSINAQAAGRVLTFSNPGTGEKEEYTFLAEKDPTTVAPRIRVFLLNKLETRSSKSVLSFLVDEKEDTVREFNINVTAVSFDGGKSTMSLAGDEKTGAMGIGGALFEVFARSIPAGTKFNALVTSKKFREYLLANFEPDSAGGVRNKATGSLIEDKDLEGILSARYNGSLLYKNGFKGLKLYAANTEEQWQGVDAVYQFLTWIKNSQEEEYLLLSIEGVKEDEPQGLAAKQKSSVSTLPVVQNGKEAADKALIPPSPFKKTSIFNIKEFLDKGLVEYTTGGKKFVFVLRKRQKTGSDNYSIDVVRVDGKKEPVAYIDFFYKKDAATWRLSVVHEYEDMDQGFLPGALDQLKRYGIDDEFLSELRDDEVSALFVRDDYRNQGRFKDQGEQGVWNLDKLLKEIAFLISEQNPIGKRKWEVLPTIEEKAGRKVYYRDDRFTALAKSPDGMRGWVGIDDITKRNKSHVLKVFYEGDMPEFIYVEASAKVSSSSNSGRNATLSSGNILFKDEKNGGLLAKKLSDMTYVKNASKGAILVAEGQGKRSQGTASMKSEREFISCHAVVIRNKETNRYVFFHLIQGLTETGDEILARINKTQPARRSRDEKYGDLSLGEFIEFLGDGEKEAIYLTRNKEEAKKSEAYLLNNFQIQTTRFVEIGGSKFVSWNMIFQPATNDLIVYKNREAYVFDAFPDFLERTPDDRDPSLPLLSDSPEEAIPGGIAPLPLSGNDSQGESSLGGIDFNAKNMNVSVKGEGAKDFRVKGIEENQNENPSNPLILNSSSSIFSDHFEGLVPIIINVTPVTDFMGLLGLGEKEKLEVRS